MRFKSRMIEINQSLSISTRPTTLDEQPITDFESNQVRDLWDCLVVEAHAPLNPERGRDPLVSLHKGLRLVLSSKVAAPWLE